MLSEPIADTDRIPMGSRMGPPSGTSENKGNPGSPYLSAVRTHDGEQWIEYRKTLTPRYGIVWRDIALCYLLLALGISVATTVPQAYGIPVTTVVTVLVALWIGYWLHALFLFGHEAAHGNLAPRRRTNDQLADWCVWVLFGSTTATYRRTHMAHHSRLGTHKDTETTYHLCLSVVNMLKGVTGWHVVEVLLRNRRAAERRREAGRGRQSRNRHGALASVRSVALHVSLLAVLLLTGRYAAALAWVVAVGAVFPLCAMLRTVVEHRRLDAPCATDFTVVEHGPVNRLFGTGPVSRTFGAAGFNRHLLHHWDPAISYTRFDEMERFFSRTPLAAEMEACRTRYGTALRTLMLEARRG